MGLHSAMLQTMNAKTYYDRALIRIRELDPKVQFPAEQRVTRCFDLNLIFTIGNDGGRRTPERQNELFRIGRRGIPGEKKVTWTLASEHVNGMAIDATLINCSYPEIEKIADIYGIYRPHSTLAKGDYGHFSLSLAEPVLSDPKVNARRLKRLVDGYSEPHKSRVLKRLY